MPEPTLTLTYSITTVAADTYKLHVESVGSDMPGEIFAIEVLPLSADAMNSNLRFSHVCCYSELLEFPAEQSVDASYFRVSEIDLIFDNADMMQKAVDNISADARKLKKSYVAVNADGTPKVSVVTV